MNTSYFANVKHITKPVSISQYPPAWFNGEKCHWLAPPKKLFAREYTYSEYFKIYYEEVLSQFTPDSLWEKLTKEYGEDITLLCFEVDGEFCHRRIVANFLEDGGRRDVPEYEKPYQPKKKTSLTF